MPRMSREQIHCDTHSQEYTGMFQGTRFPYERPDADIVAEIGLEELSGLEMEVMRRQMQVITGRLRALENRDATWYHKETILFALLLTMCLANLWLWLRQ
uniref:Fetal and adult testis expressed 1 n=1 Tax=Jaculus jaculus TaxID=51337 RepID=A0A8C5KK54_JACJA